MLTAILDSLRQASADLGATAARLGPTFAASVALAVFGLLIAWAASWGTRRVLTWSALDRFVERTTMAQALRLAELPPASRFAASIVFWLVWLAFLAAAMDTLQLPGFEHARTEFVWLVGRLARGALIVAIGLLVANVAWRATLLGAFNAGWPSPRLMAAALRILVLAVAVLTALAQIGIPMIIVLTAFSIAFGALMLGLALAFGLGGRDAARDLIARQRDAARPPDRGDQPHL